MVGNSDGILDGIRANELEILGRDDDILVRYGNVPVLVSAPHAVAHVRNGRLKLAEPLTGGIDMFLGDVIGSHAFVATRSEGDPNFDEFERNPYQRLLASYVVDNDIRLVLDLHGASSSRPFAIDVGTAPDASGRHTSLLGHDGILGVLVSCLERSLATLPDALPSNVLVNDTFDATRQTTITNSISSRCGVLCVQVEVNGALRDLNRPEGVLAVVDGLATALPMMLDVL